MKVRQKEERRTGGEQTKQGGRGGREARVSEKERNVRIRISEVRLKRQDPEVEA